MENIKIKKLVLTAMFLAIGLVLPLFTGQIPQIGSMLLPMHIPVLLCGIICGWKYGIVLGFILPIIRYMIFGMPILFPNGLAMAFEMATYGLIIGFIYMHSSKRNTASIYYSLILAMIAGRIVWGLVSAILLENLTLHIFLSAAIFNAIPGIIVQFNSCTHNHFGS